MEVTVPTIEGFDGAFGPLGLKVGPRTGPNKRTKTDREWFVIRQFLKNALSSRFLPLPLTVKKVEPPLPDFALERNGVLLGYIEHTEATSQNDQVEFTRSEQVEELVSMLGEFGGRYSDGAVGNDPERTWIAHVLRAIRRKRGKSIYCMQNAERHLVLYQNSNTAFLIDETEAFCNLQRVVWKFRDRIHQITGGCVVHVVANDFLGFDITGKMQVLKLADNRKSC